MALRKLIAGNWKMNASMNELQEIAAAAEDHSGVDVAICTPATLIAPAKLRGPSLFIGAQDCHWNASGAHTGCLSVAMLAEAGASLIIVGHSERRADNHETSQEICQKAKAVTEAGLTAIICVGETEAERDAGQAIQIVTSQIAASLPEHSEGRRTVIAYEPVWAIGTGRTPSIADVIEMHAAIRQQLIALLGDEGKALRILYGGSVKPSNAADLLAIPNVDGALVGGASLKAADFIPIITAAAAL